MSLENVLFIPLTKIDVEKREVWGCAAEEAPDKYAEVMDYAASKPHFEAWSEAIAKASDGKSLGNVRAMHGAVAAGKLVHFEADDETRKFLVGAKIVDDQEWKKVLEGVYTGFSIGGHYVRRWPDPDNEELMRYEAKPHEVSIVDNPAMYGTTFEVVKADGASEQRAFVGETPDPIAQAWLENHPHSAVLAQQAGALIIEDAGALYRVAYASDNGRVAFDDEQLVKVMVQYVPVGTPQEPISEGEPGPDLEKVAETLRQGFQAGLDALTKRVLGIEETVSERVLTVEALAALEKRVTTLEALPATPAPVIREVPGAEHLSTNSEGGRVVNLAELRRLASIEPDPVLKAEYNRQVLLAEMQLGHK